MTPTAAQQRAVQDKPSTMAGGIQGVRWALGISYRQGSPLVPPAHDFLCATSPGAQHRILAKKGEGINGGAGGGGGEGGGLAGSRLAVCIKIHAFARLASNIKIIHGGKRMGMQCTGHMFGTPAHNGWLWLPASGAAN